MAKSLPSAPSSKQPNRGSHGSAKTQQPKTTASHPTGGGRGGKAPNTRQEPKHRGYHTPGKGAAPSNGQSGNKVPGH